MRVTHALVRVAAALMEDPTAQHWGYELSKTAGVRSGVMYPLLARLLKLGWLVDGWEESKQAEKRPPRRYYRVTGTGELELAALLSRAESDVRFNANGRLAW